VTPARSARAGTCSEVITVEFQDGLGHPAVAQGETALVVTAGDSTTVHGDMGCTATPSQPSLDAGQSRASFFLRGTVAGAWQVEVKTATGTASARQTFQVNPGRAHALLFRDPPASMDVLTCGPALALGMVDAHGNAATSSSSTVVTLVADPPQSLGVSVNEPCSALVDSVTIEEGQSAVWLHLSGRVAGDVTLVASAEALTQASLALRVRPVLALRDGQVTPVGRCRPARLILDDGTGHPFASDRVVTVQLELPQDSALSLHADACCQSPLSSATLGAGVLESSVYATSSQAGSWEVGMVAPSLAWRWATMEFTEASGAEDTWLAPYCWRSRITVTGQGSAVTTGHELFLRFDHAAILGAGTSPSDGRDVRLAWFDGTAWRELHRVLDHLSTWGRADTRVWFRLPFGLGASESKTGLALYAGFPDAPAALEDAAEVFTFHDGFESGTLDKWNVIADDPSAFLPTTEQAFRGTNALKVGVVSETNRYLVAKDLDVTDVLVESSWYLSASSGFDVSQCVRVVTPASGPPNMYDLNHVSSDRWYLATLLDGTWSQLGYRVTGRTLSAGAWRRVGFRVRGDRLVGYLDRNSIIPTDSSQEAGGHLGRGSVALRTWTVPSGQAWYVDEVVVRRSVSEQPACTLNTTENR
jgi:hypothetical protein